MKKKLTKEQKRQQANNFRKNHPVEIHLNYYPSQMQSERINKFISDDESLIPFHEAAHMVFGKAMLPHFNWVYDKLADGRWGCIPDQKHRLVTTNDLNENEFWGLLTTFAAGYAGELAELGILPGNDSEGNFDPEFVECMNCLYGNALNAYRLSEKGLIPQDFMRDDLMIVSILKHGDMSDSEIIKNLTILTGMIVDDLLDDETNAEWKKEAANFKEIYKAA